MVLNVNSNVLIFEFDSEPVKVLEDKGDGMLVMTRAAGWSSGVHRLEFWTNWR